METNSFPNYRVGNGIAKNFNDMKFYRIFPFFNFSLFIIFLFLRINIYVIIIIFFFQRKQRNLKSGEGSKIFAAKNIIFCSRK